VSVLACAIFAVAAFPTYAQFSVPSTTQVHDSSALHPPVGSRVALVEFADMQCPECAKSFPLVRDAVAKYHIPLIYHDFPLAYHNWGFQAAVNARWFGLKNKKLENDYRSYIFANQRAIETPAALANYTQSFAKSRNLAFPFSPDPQGYLTAKVKADYALGQRTGIKQTPTIWVVTSGSNTAPFVEVVDCSRLFQMLDQAIASTRGR
jgi:protein-disulfide isomerase